MTWTASGDVPRVLHDLAARLIDEEAGGAATLVVTSSGDLPAIEIQPNRWSAAQVGFAVISDDELAGTIGRSAFYSGWGSDAATEELASLLTLVMQGRVEERWSLGCRLRAKPADGPAYTFGQWTPVPWWLSVPRGYDS